MASFLSVILVLNQLVSARFSWISSNINSNQNDDFLNDILNDFNLDISFTPDTKTYFIDSLHQNNENYNSDDLFIDESPSSMFSFPSIFDLNSDSSSSFQKPLYLMMDCHHDHDDHRKQQNQFNFPSKSIFSLEPKENINGNTYRYSINTDNDDSPHVLSQSWSSSKMYLCNSKSCNEQNGLEMIDIYNKLFNEMDQKYMHLVPSTTMKPFNNNDNDDEIELNIGSLFDSFGNLWNNMYNENENNMDYNVNQEIEMMNDNDINFELADDSTSTNNRIKYEEKNDLIVIEMSIIMLFIMLCGVLYAGWKFLLEKREQKRELEHYMSPELLEMNQKK